MGDFFRNLVFVSSALGAFVALSGAAINYLFGESTAQVIVMAIVGVVLAAVARTMRQ